jgi:hypothetical protein
MNEGHGTDRFPGWDDPAFVRDISLGRFGRSEQGQPTSEPSHVLRRILKALRLKFLSS